VEGENWAGGASRHLPIAIDLVHKGSSEIENGGGYAPPP
jgi:hypothetical protein